MRGFCKIFTFVYVVAQGSVACNVYGTLVSPTQATSADRWKALAKCERSLVALNAVLSRDFASDLALKESRVCACQIVSDRLRKVLNLCHSLGSSVIPNMEGVYASFPEKNRFLDSVYSWLMLSNLITQDEIAKAGDMADIFNNLLETFKLRSENILAEEKLRKLELQDRELAIREQMSDKKAKMLGNIAQQTDHIKQIHVRPYEEVREIREKERDIKVLDLEIDQNETKRTIEVSSRSLRVDDDQASLREKIAAAKERTTQHVVSTQVMEFTAAYKLEQAVQSLKEQIEQSLTEQERHRVDRKYMEFKTVLGGVKSVLETVVTEAGKISDIIMVHLGRQDSENIRTQTEALSKKKEEGDAQEHRLKAEGIKREVCYCVGNAVRQKKALARSVDGLLKKSEGKEAVIVSGITISEMKRELDDLEEQLNAIADMFK